MFMGKLIDYATNSSLQEIPLSTVTMGLGGVFVVGAVANATRIMLLNISGERIVARLREDLFSSLVWQDVEFFDKSRTGELVNRLSSDTQMVGKILTDNLAQGLRNAAQAVGSIAVMTYLSPQLTVVVLGIVPPTALAGFVYGRYVKRIAKDVQSSLAETTHVAEERFSNIRTLKSFTKESHEISTYRKAVQKVYELARRQGILSASFFGLAGLFGNLSTLGVLAYGGTLVSAGDISVGALTSFLFYTIYAAISTVGLSNFYSEYMKGLGASSKLFELLDHPRSIERIPTSIVPWNPSDGLNTTGRLSFSNVHFAYPTRPDADILHDFSIEIQPGEVLAVVGESGSGKTTLAMLLSRFYDPLQGSISLDGQDLRTLSPTSLRHQIGHVSQEPTLFSGTVADNIAYGAHSCTEEDIIHAAKQANAHHFISEFPDGYQTQVGERGLSLSGGQKQRIAIARAIIKDPGVLVLDEATSAQDASSELLVQDALEHLMANRTVILIAHRLSSLRRADRIAVLHNGRVAELGTRQELLAKEEGLFRTLYDKYTSM